MSIATRNAARALVALAALLLVAGCSRTLLTAPGAAVEPAASSGALSAEGTVPPPPNRLVSSANLLSAPPQLQLLNWVQIAQVLVKSDAQQVVSASRYELRFDKGSLTSDTTVTIKEYDPGVADVEFGPHGIKFPVPVTLSIDFSGTACDPGADIYDQSEPVLYWLNDRTNQWEVVPGRTDWVNRKYIVRLQHFSRYVLGGKAGWKPQLPRTEDP